MFFVYSRCKTFKVEKRDVMKQDKHDLLSEVERLIGKAKTPSALRKVWESLSKHKKLSPETLDHIALFVGFQSWKDFTEALHGEDDGQANYDVEEK